MGEWKDLMELGKRITDSISAAGDSIYLDILIGVRIT
jgi:hypothetical protein